MRVAITTASTSITTVSKVLTAIREVLQSAIAYERNVVNGDNYITSQLAIYNDVAYHRNMQGLLHAECHQV